MMSPASSGGVRSSVSLTAATIWLTGSSSAARISVEVSSIVFGRPVTRSRPRISVTASSRHRGGGADLELDLLGGRWPINSLCWCLQWATIASSISSPPTRIDSETTIPPSEITATSLVPPPMSRIMLPVGSATGRPQPIAAAIGSSIR